MNNKIVKRICSGLMVAVLAVSTVFGEVIPVFALVDADEYIATSEDSLLIIDEYLDKYNKNN